MSKPTNETQALASLPSSDSDESTSSQIPHESKANETSSQKPTSPSPSPDGEGIIKQIFFDCDNTLVLTETAAISAAADVVNTFVTDHSIALPAFNTTTLLTSFFGLTVKSILLSLSAQHDVALSPAKLQQYLQLEEDAIIALLHAQPAHKLASPGIQRVLESLVADSKYRIAVVSSSPMRRILAALDAANLRQYFAADQIFSAKSSLPVPKPKPSPAVYEFAMERNGVRPSECVAVEDSRSGALSAVGAGVACVAHVGAYTSVMQKNVVAETLVADGCRDVMRTWTQFEGCLERLEKTLRRECEEGLLAMND